MHESAQIKGKYHSKKKKKKASPWTLCSKLLKIKDLSCGLSDMMSNAGIRENEVCYQYSQDAVLLVHCKINLVLWNFKKSSHLSWKVLILLKLHRHVIKVLKGQFEVRDQTSGSCMQSMYSIPLKHILAPYSIFY